MITTKSKIRIPLLNNCIPVGRESQFGLSVIHCFTPGTKETEYIRYSTGANDEKINENTFKNEKFTNLECYQSINTFRTRKRSKANIAGLRAAFVDIDCNKANVSKDEVLDILDSCIIDSMLYYDDQPLSPTYIIDSGHGIHLIFEFESQVIVNNPVWVNLWERLEQELVHRLDTEFIKVFGKPLCDKGAIDVTRMLRIPTTYNNKHGGHILCRIVDGGYLKTKYYDMGKLCRDILPPKPWENDSKPQLKPTRKQNKANKVANKAAAKHKCTGYSGNINRVRVNDIKKLIRLRNYKVVHYRNNILFICSACLVAAGFDDEQVMNELIEINGSFNAPLTKSELLTIKNNIQRKRKSTYNNSFAGNKINQDKYNEYYVFKNSTIIEWLDISEDEQVRMKTLIETGEKYRRNNVRRKNHRRKHSAKHGAKYKREQRNKQIRELHAKGMKPAAIAKKLDVSRPTVYTAIKSSKN